MFDTATATAASELVADAGARPGDLFVTKRAWGAFLNTDLDRQLRRRGVRTIVLAGIATTAGVESTVRSATGLGYAVVLVEDAMTRVSGEAQGWAGSAPRPRSRP